MKKTLKRIGYTILVFLLVAILGFLGWASFPLGPEYSALASLESDSSIIVKTDAEWITFRSTAKNPANGFIFYPGGRVDYRSYAPLLRPLAAKGYLIVLVRMPLSLAVFSPNRADEVIAAYPEINNWVIGGHSLGGSMAANYCFTHPGALKGLALWASYPAASNSLADQPIKVLSLYGSEDGGLEGIEASAPLLPADTFWYRMDGGNHAQFGDYGPQGGDGLATISAQNQWQQVVNITADFLNESISP